MVAAALPDMNRFSIKDIENLTGIKAHTIRIWEQRYGILQPKRTPTNIRFYDASDLKTALRISLLNNYGYKISRIHQMTDADMSTLIQKISDPDFRLQIATNELLEAAISMDMVLFELLVNKYIHKHGIEKTVEELFFQFMEKVGLMWMTNHLMPAQEHMASAVLYRKIAVAIDGLPLPKDTNSRILLFLPEGEVHELGLMYVQYLLRKRGKAPIYLGANSPLRDVELVFESAKPQIVYTHLTAVAEDWDGSKYLNKLNELLQSTPLLVSGALLRRKKFAPTPNTTFLHNLTEVRDAIIAL